MMKLFAEPRSWNIKIPRPADWSYRVSVCIAVLCEHGKKIVCVTDNRVSFGEFSAEHSAWKNYPIWTTWLVLCAGDDIEHADPIIRKSRKYCLALYKKLRRVLEPEEVADAVDLAYSEQLQAHIENKILRKHQFDSESFQKTGKSKCTPEVYMSFINKIEKTALSLEFLICGFDAKGQGHIWKVKGDGAPTSYDLIGFWSIGMGASAALSCLAFHVSRGHLNVYSSLPDAAYLTMAAKFMSESASDVGRSTFVVIVDAKGKEAVRLVSNPGVETVRRIWEKRGVPKVPRKQIDNIVSKLIYNIGVKSEEDIEAIIGMPGYFKKRSKPAKGPQDPTPSTSQTSEPEP
jgi:hypothetical protein